MSKYDALRAEACKANLEIAELKLAILTWGNASAFDPAAGVFAIKPSGLEYSELGPESMVIVGAGVIGCEYATIFSGFGKTKVHLIDKGDRILPFVVQDDIEDAVLVIRSDFFGLNARRQFK